MFICCLIGFNLNVSQGFDVHKKSDFQFCVVKFLERHIKISSFPI